VDLAGDRAEEWASAALDAAAVAFVGWSADEPRRAAHEAGIRWELHIARGAGGALLWTLEPLHV